MNMIKIACRTRVRNNLHRMHCTISGMLQIAREYRKINDIYSGDYCEFVPLTEGEKNFRLC